MEKHSDSECKLARFPGQVASVRAFRQHRSEPWGRIGCHSRLPQSLCPSGVCRSRPEEVAAHRVADLPETVPQDWLDPREWVSTCEELGAVGFRRTCSGPCSGSSVEVMTLLTAVPLSQLVLRLSAMCSLQFQSCRKYSVGTG